MRRGCGGSETSETSGAARVARVTDGGRCRQNCITMRWRLRGRRRRMSRREVDVCALNLHTLHSDLRSVALHVIDVIHAKYWMAHLRATKSLGYHRASEKECPRCGTFALLITHAQPTNSSILHCAIWCQLMLDEYTSIYPGSRYMS